MKYLVMSFTKNVLGLALLFAVTNVQVSSAGEQKIVTPTAVRTLGVAASLDRLEHDVVELRDEATKKALVTTVNIMRALLHRTNNLQRRIARIIRTNKNTSMVVGMPTEETQVQVIEENGGEMASSSSFSDDVAVVNMGEMLHGSEMIEGLPIVEPLQPELIEQSAHMFMSEQMPISDMINGGVDQSAWEQDVDQINSENTMQD